MHTKYNFKNISSVNWGQTSSSLKELEVLTHWCQDNNNFLLNISKSKELILWEEAGSTPPLISMGPRGNGGQVQVPRSLPGRCTQ